jgi:hypothetical protein
MYHTYAKNYEKRFFMTEITTELVRRLYTVAECYEALVTSNGDITEAIDALIQREIIPEFHRHSPDGPGKKYCKLKY